MKSCMLHRAQRWRTAVAALCLTTVTAATAADWPMFGQNVANTASATSTISVSNVANLTPLWTVTTGGDVSARAAVVDAVAYFPDWAGNIWAVNANTGAVLWHHQLSDYGLDPGTVSRTSPAVANGLVYIGTQYLAGGTSPSGWLLAINAETGHLAWKVRPDTSNPFPMITASPVVARNTVFVGMTSNEEYAAADPSYVCCSVGGSVVAVNATNGQVLWQTFTVPPGYSGGNVWGSHPVADLARNTLFVSTGNNYSEPNNDPAYAACRANGGSQKSCLAPNDFVDAVLALDMKTGKIKWATRLTTWNSSFFADGSDFWNVACIFAGPNCPTPPGPDYDFGSAPNEITYQTPKGPKTIIGAGQKSGIYYALDPDTGQELWQTEVGPGSTLGGIEWGSASDGKRIYVAIVNLYAIPYAGGNAGSWAALDPATGKILWRTADPNGGYDLGPLAVANGVLYAPSMGGPSSSTAPTMFALNAATGATLWNFVAGSSVNGGATIVGRTVYWGSGYSHLGSFLGTGNNKFYAFGLPH